jgi:hypothetical protein
MESAPAPEAVSVESDALEIATSGGAPRRTLTGLELLQTIAAGGTASVLTIYRGGRDQCQYWVRDGMLELLMTPRGHAHAAVSSGAAALLLEQGCMFTILPFDELPTNVADYVKLNIPIEEVCLAVAQSNDEGLLDPHYRPILTEEGIDWLHFHHCINREPLQYKVFKPQNETFLIGRSPECEVRLDDPSVSDVHCQISIRYGVALVEDLGSTNGTFIDDRKVFVGIAYPNHWLRVGQAFVYLSQTRVSMFGISDEESRLIRRTSSPSTTMKIPSADELQARARART